MEKSDVVASIVVQIIILLISAILFMWIWNSYIPDIFEGVNRVSYGASVGILILSSLIFKTDVRITKEDK